MRPEHRPPDPEESAAELARTLGERLLLHAQVLSLAESCTGGLVAKLLTDIAGSSNWFDRGLVTYSNAAKQDLLGVPSSILETTGAVSRDCAIAMAEGLIARTPAHWGVAITGIAGPGGGSADKPVGTVWIAWIHRGGPAQPQRFLFPGDRAAVRWQSAQAALEGLLERLNHAG
jgi:nicotinamide-nucleotide amidase